MNGFSDNDAVQVDVSFRNAVEGAVYTTSLKLTQ